MGKSNINIKYKCLGASREVTGSCGLLSVNYGTKQYNIVVDYGMKQNNLKKINELYAENKMSKSIAWEKVDVICLTHSHADHSALLPVAIMQGFEGDIITTAPCIKLTELILTDSAYIQARETERHNKTRVGKKNPIYPIYGQRHVSQTMERFHGYDYNAEIKLNENISMRLLPAGHLLGASSIYIEVRDGMDVRRVLFTGDTSAKKKSNWTRAASFKDLKIDTLFTEGTYGNRLHKRKNVKQKLKKHISETVLKNEGKLIIPVFSVGRSSSVIKELYDVFQENEEFQDIEVFLASPMACKSHRIYGERDSFNFYNESYEKYGEYFKWGKLQYIEEYPILEKKGAE